MKAAWPSAEHYEALRSNAVAPAHVLPTDPLGAIVVVRNGMAGWIRRWDRVCGLPPSPQRSSLPPRAIAHEANRELARLLAEMTAPHLQSLLS